MAKYVIVAVCLLLLFPIYYMVQGSFQKIIGIMPTRPILFPRSPTLDNYRILVGLPMLGQWAANSLLVFAGYVGAAVLVNGLAGYVFSLARFPGKEVVFWIFLATMLITRYAIFIPQFVVIRMLHLREIPAVILMIAFWPAGIYLFRNYFDSIPRSLIDCARIDGANDWTIFLRVVLPLAKPILGATVVMKGIESLSDYIWQNLNMVRQASQTLLVGLTQSIFITRTGLMRNLSYELAIGVVLLVPLLAIFASASRFFLKGITLGAVKE